MGGERPTDKAMVDTSPGSRSFASVGDPNGIPKLVPHCCSIMLTCTFQTVQYPVLAVGGVDYRLKSSGKAPRMY